MNPVALYLASGESLYVGALIVLLVVPLKRKVQGKGWNRLLALAMWVGLAMMVMACPPLPWTIDALFFLAFIAWLITTSGQPIPTRRWPRITSAGSFIILLLIVPISELRWRAMPTIQGPRAHHLTIIGDSISAGIASDDSRWPLVFQKATGVPAKNLSRPGAQVSDALDQCKHLDPSDTLLLIEIGGNDLIVGTPTADFERDLDRLLAASARPGRTLVMFELPLLPHRIGYGRAQRKLAQKYDVSLIPKRFLIDVLRTGDATSDGLHLSPVGAKTMTELVRVALAPLLPPPSTR